MRVRLQIVGIFIAVGLGALTITLLHDPKALIPNAPYGDWILVVSGFIYSLPSCPKPLHEPWESRIYSPSSWGVS